MDQGGVSIQRGVFARFGENVISLNMLLLRKCVVPFLVGTIAAQMS